MTAPGTGGPAVQNAQMREPEAVCGYLLWRDTNCAVGRASGICGRCLVDGKCPGNPAHYGTVPLSAAAGSVGEVREP